MPESCDEKEVEGSKSYNSEFDWSPKASKEVAHEKIHIPPNLEIPDHQKSPINLNTTILKLEENVE